MVGIGGILGSLAGGYLTEYEATRWCFAIYAVVGFLIGLSSWIMDKSCEQENEELIGASLKERSKQNMKGVWQGLKCPELHRSILYFLIMGFLIPNFTDFLYYY